MQTFRILYFREDILEYEEVVRAQDLLKAIAKASGKLPHLRAEIWSGDECVSEIGSCPTA